MTDEVFGELTSITSNFYVTEYALYGKDSRSLGWSKSSQLIRFEKLGQLSNIKGRTVLDIGCGFADLYDYLKVSNLHPSRYLGIEPFLPFYEISKKNLESEKEAAVLPCAIEEFSSTVTFDVVVAIGICNLIVRDNYFVLFSLIDKMLILANDSIFVSILSDSASAEIQKKGAHATFFYSKEIIFSRLETLGYTYNIHEGYLPHDMFIEIKKGA
jgi:cyclopropane fatty-acyl-phospholipid synthase-like methyltransferase